MESGDLRRALQAAAVGDRVLQQEIAIAMAAEKELQRVAREQCSAVVDQYLAEKRVAASEAKPGSSRSVEAVDAHYEQDAHEQASSMMQKFLAERAELWTAQLRALLQVSSLRQEQSHLLNRLHQQQRLSSGIQDSAQQHEPGSSSASLLVPSASHVPEPTPISSAPLGEARSSTPQQNMGASSSMQPCAAPQQTTTNIVTPKGKGSAAIRRERARLAEERGLKPKGTLNRQRKECKKRRDLKYKQAAAAAAQQRPWWQWKQPNKGGGVL